jgi:hypothetical protein
VHNTTLAATACAARIVAAFATRATGQEGPVQRCTGFHRLADNVRQNGGAAVGVHGAGIILHADQQRRQWWHPDSGGCGIGNVVTKSTKTMPTT